MTVNWTDTAIAHLQAIHAHIALNSPYYAQRTIDRITRRSEQLANLPHTGAIVPEYASEEVREILEKPYRVIYRTLPDRVDLLAVIRLCASATSFDLIRKSLRSSPIQNVAMDPSRLIFLAIETTCDETGAAVLEGPRPPATGVPRVLSSVVASQASLHQRFGGVVPEIASRAHVQQVLPMIDEALRRAGVTLKDLGMIAVATRPGLVGALVVGLTAAKTLALALDLPLIAVDHLEGHLYACQLANPEQAVYPCVGLVVSGGHTSLYHCRGPLHCELLGGTMDDAAGEAFDKVASLLSLGYPGGPEIERVARAGDPRAFAFPRSFLHDDRPVFSFSGLKTAVLYALRGPNEERGVVQPSPALVADLAASFQEAVIDVLVAKTRQALEKTGLKRLGVGGGVAANTPFRDRIAAMARERGVELFIPPLSLCTDNAAMAGIALAKLAAGEVSALNIDVTAGLVRPGREKKRVEEQRPPAALCG